MRTLLLLAVFMLCACIVTAQVNFTPTWGQGKRNAPASVQATDECKSMDTLIYIYKLVQNEAQRIAMCERMSTS
ncbi:adipokinetic prohormone type 1-like [Sipha flava]|uniref:Adipokinetic prohormone type 1-like n=1 Tax=Sipha flava TaxID=143950 RepID=A0A8B8GJT3_9HEMI|nr:adipokinetic prohormone type 1-like [Sipha flava]XP_025422857.1 adipokinetic prohormone type 1-like [Sipha flava]